MRHLAKSSIAVIALSILYVFTLAPSFASAPALPKRIVCFSPAAAEVLFALGAKDRLCGVSDFCTYPPEIKSIATVGGFYNPNLERLAALAPDLVIVQGHHDKVADFCKKRGLPILHVDMDSIAGIGAGIATLGKLTASEAKAAAMWAGIEKDLAAVKKAVYGLKPKRVFVCVGRSPDGLASVNTASAKSFVGELLKIAGGENVFSDLDRPYPEISKEALLKRAPEFVLELRPGESLSPARKSRIIGDWDVLSPLPAVRNKKVIVLTEDYLLLPGPRVAQAARTLAKTLHPEAALP